MFALVQNGEVVQRIETPRVIQIGNILHTPGIFGTVAGRQAGILPLEEVRPPFDPATQYLAGPEYQVGPDKVTAAYSAADHPLAMAKDMAWQAVKAWREARKDDPFQFAGRWYQGDRESVRLINGAVLMALAAKASGAPFAIGWGAANDAVVELDADGMIGLGVAKGQGIAACWAGADAAWVAISAATTAQACRDAVAAFKAAFKAVVLVADPQRWQDWQANPPDPNTTYINLTA